MDFKKPSKARANEKYLEFLASIDALPYKEEIKEEQKLFLIICEGINTEPEYFKGFPVPSKSVIIQGGKNSKNSLVDYAINLKNSGEYAGREIWCVFDYDIKPDEAETQPNDFNSSIIKAYANGLNVAWSNDAFELWFALHYNEIEVAITRREIYRILKVEWGLKRFSAEAKKINFCQSHYIRHGGDKSELQKLAIRRARKLHQAYNDRKDFSNHNPCTTVYLLVEELNKYLK